jgi:uracil-DNA glycosylase family protein
LPKTRLARLADDIDACRRCPLWRNATQGVTGEGRVGAVLMMVGEQPGDKEDLAGHPFVGPAGRMLDRAIEDAGLTRKDVYITNAVKHFKNEPRGKRRIHKKPNTAEIEACRWWLDQEMALVRPEVIVALGATAARAILQRPVKIGLARGKPLVTEAGARVFVTIHPSYLLRLRDAESRRAQYEAFVADLHRAGRAAA